LLSLLGVEDYTQFIKDGNITKKEIDDFNKSIKPEELEEKRNKVKKSEEENRAKLEEEANKVFKGSDAEIEELTEDDFKEEDLKGE
jgi:lipoate-protein ligase A